MISYYYHIRPPTGIYSIFTPCHHPECDTRRDLPSLRLVLLLDSLEKVPLGVASASAARFGHLKRLLTMRGSQRGAGVRLYFT